MAKRRFYKRIKQTAYLQQEDGTLVFMFDTIRKRSTLADTKTKMIWQCQVEEGIYL